MRLIRKFSSFKSINESEESDYSSFDEMEEAENFDDCKFSDLGGNVTLYRLTSHPVVDLSEPGEYYVCDKGDLDPNLLDKPGTKLYLITVTCDSSNIDASKSQKECQDKSNNSIVAVMDDTKCKFVSCVPFNPGS
jgi:hypothetical protein